MPNWSKKPPEEPKSISVEMEGSFHRRFTAMAKAHHRSLRKEIAYCLEDSVRRWETEGERGAAASC
jgi:predicted HicB family RNase H-like nuclease